MATELPYQTYERLTGKTWTGGTTQPILDAYKQYGITAPAASSEANLALQAAMLKGLPTKTTDTKTDTGGITVPDAPTGSNPVVSSTSDRGNIDALGNTIKTMADTSGLSASHDETTKMLNDRMTALDQQRQAEIARITSEFDQASKDQETRQTKDYAGTSTNLVTAGGGFLGYTGSQQGVLKNLQQTFESEKAALLSKRQSAIQQAQSAYDEKQFALAAKLADEAKNYESDLYQRQKDHADQLLAVARENRSQSEYERTTVENNLKDLSLVASSDKELSLDPTKAKQIDNFYGVPGFTKQYLEVARKQAQTKSNADQVKTDIDIQTLLAKVPAGQKVTIGDKTYVGMKKATPTSSSGTISPLIIQQIPQLAPLQGMKEDDIIMSLELSKPPVWFTQSLKTNVPNAPIDQQAAWDTFRNDPDLVSYRNTVRLNKRQSINATDPAAQAAALKAALGIED